MRAMRVVMGSLLGTMDASWDQLADRLAGLGDDEYRWEPVAAMWSVRPTGDGWVVDVEKPDPDPAPATTIAWRLWHLAVDCLDSYSARIFGTGGTGLEGRQWVGTADEAVAALERAWRAFRDGVAGWGGTGLFEPLGPDWGPHADRTHLDLALHAHRELTHHGAEIALLRDLYPGPDAAR